MLLNYNDTLDAVFTLAHEMGHSMHTLLSHAHQPFVYAGYTIFVAEVPSTLSEALFLEYMLARTTDERERIVLLQHAIDGIVGTFYTQVMFADYELQAHRLVEEGQPVTGGGARRDLLRSVQAYHGDAIDYDDQSRVTWARIPHFYSTPYYVYQYATCFASSAQLMKQLTGGSGRRAGGGDRPLSDAAQVRRQRSPDDAAAARRRRSQPAGTGACGRRATRRAGHATGEDPRGVQES